MDFPTQHAATIGAWGGEDRPLAYGAAQPPIVHSATFSYPDVDSWQAVATGEAAGHIYSRNTNPTLHIFEEKMRLLEGGDAATSFSSGMAAISNSLFALLRPNDRVVSITDSYGGTSRIFLEILPRLGVDVTLVKTEDGAGLLQAIRQGCRMVYIETPTNPTLKVVDLIAALNAARSVGAITIVDNTFATPINQKPIALGADLVVHSATKFLGGHDDALGGIVVGRQDLVREIFQYREITGATLDAFSAYLLLRGLKTLDLRVNRQNQTALAIARMLSDHPAVDQVFYPGLEQHPNHAAARLQMSGFGGVLSFSVRNGGEAARQVLNRLKLVHRAASLGSVNSLAGLPATTSHVECTPEQRAQLGIPEALIRYSCGIEAYEDLADDLRNALAGA